MSSSCIQLTGHCGVDPVVHSHVCGCSTCATWYEFLFSNERTHNICSCWLIHQPYANAFCSSALLEERRMIRVARERSTDHNRSHVTAALCAGAVPQSAQVWASCVWFEIQNESDRVSRPGDSDSGRVARAVRWVAASLSPEGNESVSAALWPEAQFCCGGNSPTWPLVMSLNTTACNCKQGLFVNTVLNSVWGVRGVEEWRVYISFVLSITSCQWISER